MAVNTKCIDGALNIKFASLNMMGRHRDALECAKELYCLYLTTHTHPPAIKAGFVVIESCIQNKEYFDAVLYARTSWETITLSRDSHIPDNQREEFTAKGAYYLAKALLYFAISGGMPAEEKEVAGREAIVLARRALEIDTQLRGLESQELANDRCLLGQVLDHFNNLDDDDVPRLYEQAKETFSRVQGSLTPNVAAVNQNLATMYNNRAKRAMVAKDVEREVSNLDLSLAQLNEAARIYRAINQLDRANQIAQETVGVQGNLRDALKTDVLPDFRNPVIISVVCIIILVVIIINSLITHFSSIVVTSIIVVLAISFISFIRNRRANRVTTM